MSLPDGAAPPPLPVPASPPSHPSSSPSSYLSPWPGTSPTHPKLSPLSNPGSFSGDGQPPVPTPLPSPVFIDTSQRGHSRPPSPSPPPTSASPPHSPHSTYFTPHSRLRRSSISRLVHANVHVRSNIAQTASDHEQETTSSILHDVVFHQIPSLCSPHPIRRMFARNLDTVIRSTIAFIVAAVIAVQPWATSIFAIPYLFAMFTASTVKPTVGSTLANIDTQGKGVLAAACIDTIITGAGVSSLSDTPRRIVCEVLLFFTSALLAYYFHAPAARRFSLACHGLTIILIANGTNTNVYLPFQIFLCFVSSYLISFFLVLLPFPRLAKDELLDRYQQALLTLSTVCSEVVSSYIETEPIAPLVLYSTAQSQLEDVSRSLTIMRRLAAETSMESALFHWLFPASHSLGSPFTPDPDHVERIYWVLSNLLHTLHTLHYTSYHATFVAFLREPFQSFSQVQREYIGYLAMDQPVLITKEGVEGYKRRLEQVMGEAWERYTIAREWVYGTQYGDQQALIERVEEVERRVRRGSVDDSVVTRTGRPSGVEGGETTGLLPSTNMLIQHPAAHFAKGRTRLHHTTSDVFHRSCFFFYLNRYHHALSSMEFVFPAQAAAPSPTPSASTSSSSPSHARAEKLQRILSSIADHMRHPLRWSFVGFHPFLDFAHLVTSFLSFLRHPSLDVGWLKASIKVALIICVSSVIAVTPQLQATNIFPNALWCTFTAAIVTSDTEGALWQRGLHRLLGTFVGGSIGFFILDAFPFQSVGAIALLSVWSIPSLMVQASPTYSYLGSLAQLTPIVVVFGYQITIQTTGITPDMFAFARIEEIIIGVIIAIAISTLLWPVSSIRLLRSEIMVSVEAFTQGVDRTMQIYETMARMEQQRRRGETDKPTIVTSPAEEQKESTSHSAADAPTKADGMVNPVSEAAKIDVEVNEEDELLRSLLTSSHSIQMSLSRQSRLLTEALSEPVLFFTTFPTDAYKQLASTQRRIWQLVLTIQPALEQILQQEKAALTQPTSELVREELFNVSAVGNEMRLMMDEVVSVLGRCGKGLESGRMVGRVRVGQVVRSVQGIEKKFAENLNLISQRVQEGKGKMLNSRVIVPIAVFFSSSVQLAEQVLIFNAAVCRLLELERPKAYDD